MSNRQSSLFDMNWAALVACYPQMAQTISSSNNAISIHEREDGYFYAAYSDYEREYTMGKNEDIAADLRNFRKEISNALTGGVDLIFLMGIGLGYRACVAFDMARDYACGLVILESTPEWINTACQCSNLQPLFQSNRVELLVSANLKEVVASHIRQKQWYGARKSAFFLGGQSSDYAQHDYSDLISYINEQNKTGQQEFFVKWQNWFQNQFQNQASNQKKHERVLIVYEQSCTDNELNEKLRDVKNNLDQDLDCIEMPIDGNGFVPLTLILNQVIDCHADAVYCLGFKPEKWIAEDALKAMPVEVKML